MQRGEGDYEEDDEDNRDEDDGKDPEDDYELITKR